MSKAPKKTYTVEQINALVQSLRDVPTKQKTTLTVQETVEALRETISGLRERGYTFTDIQKMLADGGVVLNIATVRSATATQRKRKVRATKTTHVQKPTQEEPKEVVSNE